MAYARRAAREEGLLVGDRILTFAYDTGERYLSVEALWG